MLFISFSIISFYILGDITLCFLIILFSLTALIYTIVFLVNYFLLFLYDIKEHLVIPHRSLLHAPSCRCDDVGAGCGPVIDVFPVFSAARGE